MPPNVVKLGWSNPPGGGYTGPDGSLLQRQFNDLSTFTSFKWVHAQVAAGTAVAGYAVKTLVAVKDPHSMVTGGKVRVPPEFNDWLFQGYLFNQVVAAGAGLYQIGLFINTVLQGQLTADWYSAGAVAQRASLEFTWPVKGLDLIEIAMGAPAATTLGPPAELVGFFMPLS